MGLDGWIWAANITGMVAYISLVWGIEKWIDKKEAEDHQ